MRRGVVSIAKLEFIVEQRLFQKKTQNKTKKPQYLNNKSCSCFFSISSPGVTAAVNGFLFNHLKYTV